MKFQKIISLVNMKSILCIGLLFGFIVQVGCTSIEPKIHSTMETFTRSESLEKFIRKVAVWEKEIDKQYSENRNGNYEEVMVTGTSRKPFFTNMPDSIETNSSITNNQEEGVDEGDIVKRVGQHIIVLRRGRLFSFSLTSETTSLAAVDFIDVEPTNGKIEIDTWYDEILTYGNTIILLGYEYDENATLVRKYKITEAGKFVYGDSFFFSSDDYFDAENYATRLIGSNLVFYTPSQLPVYGKKDLLSGRIVNGMPVGVKSAFSSKVIYKPILHSDNPVIHTIAQCPLDKKELRCSATGVVGPEAQLLYISNNAVYLWLSSTSRAYDYFGMSDFWLRAIARSHWHSNNDINDTSVVYRIPIDGGEPQIIGVNGSPMNHYSFRETDTSLQVIVRRNHDGGSVQPGLLNIPFNSFSSTFTQLASSHITELPLLAGKMSVNRFVGSTLLYDDTVLDYGTNIGERRFESTLMVKNLNTDAEPVSFGLDHYIERIEPVNGKALVIGSDYKSGLGITSFNLQGQPNKGETFKLLHSIQADERSHSFNYEFYDDAEIVGIPVIQLPDGVSYWDYWFEKPQNIQMRYFRLESGLDVSEIGMLVGTETGEDYCFISCVDWYGDSRPFFIDNQIYALLGYELIEGYISGNQVFESNRANGLDLLDKDTLRAQ